MCGRITLHTPDVDEIARFAGAYVSAEDRALYHLCGPKCAPQDAFCSSDAECCNAVCVFGPGVGPGGTCL